MKEFLVFSFLIYGFMVGGWGARKLRPTLQRYSQSISRSTVLLIETPAIVLIYWGIKREEFFFQLRIPLIAVCVMSLSGIAGYLIARLYRQNRQFTGAYTVASLYSNIGPTLGGFLCLLYFGNQGLILSQIYALICVPYFFTVVFLTARFFSPAQKIGLWDAIKLNFRDPISILPLSAVITGLGLAFTETEFPMFLELPRRFFVYLTVALYSISFGLGMEIRRMLKGIKYYLGILPVKFLISPLVGFGFSLVLGYSLNSQPLVFKVILVQAAMPVGIWSVVASKIFNLDDNLALGLWIFTTASVAGLVPLVDWVSGI
jgi:predicted permease